ncbi:hypothetical protein N657DRAFT_91401 [Parathielavia appendiculata]|uniref:Uncharacterized protein n=1 Tax=Parathielavia appendiculata TaxID=2587402 RepID=A0AAN6Z975_9PEZI|nr:hypothetical protein N657DRAFT_91401 [Parathielavia appendiculata]
MSETDTDSLLQRCISAVDILFNAVAGAAAVATGAHVNGEGATAFAIRVGVLAAVTKSGVRAFVAFLSLASMDIASWSLLVLVLSKFGIAVLVTAQVCSQVLGHVPSPLLIAAIVAAIPWQAEGYGPVIRCGGSSSYSHSNGYRTITSTTHRFDPCRFFCLYIYIIGWDALAGHTFARMAQNQGAYLSRVYLDCLPSGYLVYPFDALTRQRNEHLRSWSGSSSRRSVWRCVRDIDRHRARRHLLERSPTDHGHIFLG